MMGGFGGFGMLLWIGLIVAAMWWLVQAAGSQKVDSAGAATPPSTAREVLDARLARGEITLEQYRELRKALDEL